MIFMSQEMESHFPPRFMKGGAFAEQQQQALPTGLQRKRTSMLGDTKLRKALSSIDHWKAKKQTRSHNDQMSLNERIQFLVHKEIMRAAVLSEEEKEERDKLQKRK